MKIQFGKDVYLYDKIHVSKSTFIAGLTDSVHRWFRLTPSFGSNLVDMMLEECSHKKGEIVLDPFAGASTTLIQCQLNDIKSYGFEINPFLVFVGQTSLNSTYKHADLKSELKTIVAAYNKMKKKFSAKDIEAIGLKIPPIHNVHRWWRMDVLKDLLILKEAIQSLDGVSDREFFRLCLAGVLVPDLTNVTLGKLQLHFIDRSSDTIEVLPTFLKHAEKMISDVEQIDSLKIRNAGKLIHTDSTKVNSRTIKEKIDVVITSPPYPNRYSYVWNTRPHLFFFDLFETGKQSSDLDLKTIGGTWGSATSILQKGTVEPEHSFLKKIVGPTAAKIRDEDPLMANYLMKYFNLLTNQVMAMMPLLSANARLAYVVGNVNLKGVYVEVDSMLARVFEELGFAVPKIHRFRKRHSGVDLYESIVYANRINH